MREPLGMSPHTVIYYKSTLEVKVIWEQVISVWNMVITGGDKNSATKTNSFVLPVVVIFLHTGPLSLYDVTANT